MKKKEEKEEKVTGIWKRPEKIKPGEGGYEMEELWDFMENGE